MTILTLPTLDMREKSAIIDIDAEAMLLSYGLGFYDLDDVFREVGSGGWGAFEMGKELD